MRVVEEFAAFLDLNQSDEVEASAAEWGRARLKTLMADLSRDEQLELRRFLTREAEASSDSYRAWVVGLADRLELAQE
jgi:hypothetical protein